MATKHIACLLAVTESNQGQSGKLTYICVKSELQVKHFPSIKVKTDYPISCKSEAEMTRK